VKSPTDTPKQGNYLDTFVKKMFGQVVVFADFLLTYADPAFVKEINLKKIKPAPTHYIGKEGDERIVDLVFQCPLKSGMGSLMAVIVFEHQSGNLKKIPQKLHKYIAAIWDAETKAGKPLSAPYFLVLRTAKKPHRGKFSTMADSLPKGKDGEPVGKRVEIEYNVVDLPAWKFDTLIGGTVLRLALGMLHKMTGDNLDEFPAALKPLLEISDEDRQIELTKELLDFVDKAFKAHNRRLDAAQVSGVLQTVFQERANTMIKSVFDEKEAIGEARGEARGKAETGRNAVLAVLRARFKRVPKDIEQAIRQMSDSIALESLAAHAATCESLDDFATALK
jgi:hypothetical protein